MRGLSYSTEVASPEVVTGLKAVDPDAELHHLGDNLWMLGVRRTNEHALKKLQTMLESQEKMLRDTDGIGGSLEWAHRRRVIEEFERELELLTFYAHHPFRPIHMYECDRAPDMDIVKDFQLRDYNLKRNLAGTEQQLIRDVSFDAGDEARTERMREYVDQEAGGWWHKVMAGAKSKLFDINPLARRKAS